MTRDEGYITCTSNEHFATICFYGSRQFVIVTGFSTKYNLGILVSAERGPV